MDAKITLNMKIIILYTFNPKDLTKHCLTGGQALKYDLAELLLKINCFVTALQYIVAGLGNLKNLMHFKSTVL